MASISSETPFLVMVVSSSLVISSKVKPYWKPEQPPPCTNTRSLRSGLPSSAIRSATLAAALSVKTIGSGIMAGVWMVSATALIVRGLLWGRTLRPINQCYFNQQKTARRRFLDIASGKPKTRSALRELLAAACGMQADLLALDFTRIARHEASLAQHRLERRVVVDQRTGDAVARRAGLTRFTAAGDVDHDVEGFDVVRQEQRLLRDHDGGFPAEISLDVLAIDRDLAGALLDEHAGDARFATAGAVVPFTNHSQGSLQFQHFGLLGGMRVLCTTVHLEFLDHRVTERALGQHALDSLFQGAARVLGLHVAEVRRRDTARVARVTVVHLVDRLGAGHAELRCVDDDDEVTGVDVRRVNGLVFAAQTESNFAGYSSEDLVGRVNHKPLVHHVSGFCAERFHEYLSIWFGGPFSTVGVPLTGIS